MQTCKFCYRIVARACQSDTESADCPELIEWDYAPEERGFLIYLRTRGFCRTRLYEKSYGHALLAVRRGDAFLLDHHTVLDERGREVREITVVPANSALTRGDAP